MRRFLAILAGMVTGFILIGLMEAISGAIYPVPEGMDLADPEARRQWIEMLPLAAKLFVLIGWALGVFSATAVTTLIQKELQWQPSLLVTALFLLGAVLNLLMIPHPAWFWPAAVIVHIVFGLLGYLLMRRRKKQHNTVPHA